MKRILERLASLADQLDSTGHYTMAGEIDNILKKTALYAAPEERFWAKVDKDPKHNGCWIWLGAKTTGGYGIVTINGKNYQAHTLSYEWANKNKVPKGFVLLHTCDNKNCVRDTHLSPGTQIENIKDRVSKDRSAKGKNNGRARLKKKDIKKIKSLRNKGMTESAIAKLFGVGRSTISHILKNRTWSWV